MKTLLHDGPDTFILTITFLFKELETTKNPKLPWRNPKFEEFLL